MGPNFIRRSFKGALVAVILAASACQPREPAGNLDNAAEQATLNLPLVPKPQPPLDRAGLFAGVAQAASAAARGADDGEAQRLLDGRQFELRVRFGCQGPSNDLRDVWLGWSREAKSGTLRVRAMPTLGADDSLVRDVGGDEFEAVEGFWIPRPWLLEPACPANAAVLPATANLGADSASDGQPSRSTKGKAAVQDMQSADPVPNWPKIGIAQFFTDTDPRTERRSMRPYEAVKTVDPNQPIGSQGFDLVLSGRLRALPGGRVIACLAKSPDNAPECIVSAQFDGVRIERPENREIIAK